MSDPPPITNPPPPPEPEPGPGRFNPDFWEVTLTDAAWAELDAKRARQDHHDEDAEARQARRDRAAELWPVLREVMDSCLSERQRQVVELYFLRGLNQTAIATLLGISQQAVSEHIYGKTRDGGSVGGALRKLRKQVGERGIRW